MARVSGTTHAITGATSCGLPAATEPERHAVAAVRRRFEPTSSGARRPGWYSAGSGLRAEFGPGVLDELWVGEQVVGGLGDERRREERRLLGTWRCGGVPEGGRVAGRAFGCDRQLGMDRRTDPADVAHVGRAGEGIRSLVLDSVGTGVLHPARLERSVLVHGCRTAGEGDLDRRVGRERRRLGKGAEPFAHL